MLDALKTCVEAIESDEFRLSMSVCSSLEHMHSLFISNRHFHSLLERAHVPIIREFVYQRALSLIKDDTVALYRADIPLTAYFICLDEHRDLERIVGLAQKLSPYWDRLYWSKLVVRLRVASDDTYSQKLEH